MKRSRSRRAKTCFYSQQRDSSRGRRREKEDIKITKERTPASEEEPTEWETTREGSRIRIFLHKSQSLSVANDSRVELSTRDNLTRVVCHRPSRPDSDIGDYDYELSLEMKRQKIQRELMKLEQENLDKREEIIIKKDEAPAKIRAAAVSKASCKVVCPEIVLSFFSLFFWPLCIISTR